MQLNQIYLKTMTFVPFIPFKVLQKEESVRSSQPNQISCSTASPVCDKRRLQTCRPQTCRPQTCRPADLQTCRLDKLAHSEICRPTFFVTSTGHVSSFLRAFQKPGHPSISRQNGWRWEDFYLVDYIEVVVLRWRVLRDNRILLRILTER